MNRKQIVALWAGVVLILLACLFPPTTIMYVGVGPSPIPTEQIELNYVFSDPIGAEIHGKRMTALEASERYPVEFEEDHTIWYVEGVRVDYLAMIWVAIGAVTLGAVLSLKR